MRGKLSLGLLGSMVLVLCLGAEPVKYEANWKYVLTIPAAFMSIFLILMLIPDVGMRNRYASSERKLFMANPVQNDTGHAESVSYDTHHDDEDE